MNFDRLTRDILVVVACALMPHCVDAQDKKEEKWLTDEPTAQWIWASDHDAADATCFFRKQFDVNDSVKSAKLFTTCDNTMTLWLNGEEIGKSRDWMFPIQTDVTRKLKPGRNTIAVQAKNAGGAAGFVLKLQVQDRSRKTTTLVSDGSWKLTTREPAAEWLTSTFDDSDWNELPRVIKSLGSAPWGIPGGSSRRSGKGQSETTHPDEITVPDGFEVELIYTVPMDEQGSWVSLTNGPQGTLIACDQGDKGIYSIAVQESDSGPSASVASLGINMPKGNERLSGAQGLLYAFDALWVHKNGGHLYRVPLDSKNGQYGAAEELPSETGGGEHGNHALILTADEQAILMDGGNHAPLHSVTQSRVTSWQEDQLLPRMWDANGHARGLLAPGGWVTRLNPQNYEQELICIGFRNQYDIAVNRFGDVFTFDADMEWDLGSPWYRPTRICQVVSGGDYGWRSGTGKFPTFYEDSLPPVVDIGPGSPTGVTSCVGANFPLKYRDSILALDWTFGTIYAVHLRPKGAGYEGHSEPFVTGVPLPVTDAVIGSDHWLYFTVGGRGTQSALYRVRYTRPLDHDPQSVTRMANEEAAARASRVTLEGFHGVANPKAVESAWPFLSSTDRFLRNAARVAVESQPVSQWDTRVLAETNAQAKITGAVALARRGNADHRSSLIRMLSTTQLSSLDKMQQLGLLRAYALTFMRLGKPDEEERRQIIAQLDPLLPTDDGDLNTELIRVLVYLNTPGVVDKVMNLISHPKPPVLPDWTELASRNERYGATVNRMLENHPPSTEIGYALMLRTVRDGWTLASRRAYFEFLNHAAKASGGASYPGFLTNIREEALGNCSDAERAALQDITGEDFNPMPTFEILPIAGPGRKWTLDEAMNESTKGFNKASFENGRSLYFAASCGKCHRMAGLGGNVGPDLTSIRTKFDVNYLVEHILDPNKVISDQYQASVVLTSDGRTLTGLVAKEDDQVTIYPADVNAPNVTIAADEIETIRPSATSQMPAGLVDTLNRDELRDLLAYLMSGGNPEDKRVYGK